MSTLAEAIPSTHHVVSIEKYGDADELKYVEAPVPTPTAGQVLIKNAFIGVNFIDVYHRTGLYKVPLPFVFGREASGTVASIGEGVTGFKVGDKVMYFQPHTYAEYTVVPEGFVIKLPDGVSEENAGAFLLQGITAWTQMTEDCPLKRGDTILIHAAAGGTGAIQVQVAKHLGATVIGTCSTSKIGIAKAAGADFVIDYTKEDVASRVKEITNGRGVDAVFDGIGKSTFETSLSCLKVPGGWMVAFGNASGPVAPVPLSRLAAGNFRLMHPSVHTHLKPAEQFQKHASHVMELVATGALRIRIHKKYSLKDAAQAHRDLESGKTTGKLLLVP